MSGAVVYLGADVPIRAGTTITFRARFTGTADTEAVRREVELPHVDGAFTDTTIENEGGIAIVTTQLRLGHSPTGCLVVPLSFLGAILGLWLVVEVGDAAKSLEVFAFFMGGVALLPMAVIAVQQARSRLKSVDLDALQTRFEQKCRDGLNAGSLPLPGVGTHEHDGAGPSSFERLPGA